MGRCYNQNMAVKRTSHARYDLWYHFAWSTKYRKKVFRAPHTQEKVKELFRTVASHYDIELGEVNCQPDHIHMSAGAPPRIAPSQIAQILKSRTTTLLFQELPWLKNEYWGGEIWIAGYFVRSVGPGVTKETIEKYIREQSEEI